jgi:hypothetical protein
VERQAQYNKEVGHRLVLEQELVNGSQRKNSVHGLQLLPTTKNEGVSSKGTFRTTTYYQNTKEEKE